MLGQWVMEEESDSSDLLTWVIRCGREILASFEPWECYPGFRGAEISPFLHLPHSSQNLPAHEAANWEQNEVRFCGSGSARMCSVLALQRKALYSYGIERKIQSSNFCHPHCGKDLVSSCLSAGMGGEEHPVWGLAATHRLHPH